MELEEFDEAIRKDDFAVGDSFWLGDWEFEVVNRRQGGTLVADDTMGWIIAGKPYSANVTVENGKQEGLAKIELAVIGQKMHRWLWLQAGEKKEVIFKGLTAPDSGTHEVRCGDVTQSLHVEH